MKKNSLTEFETKVLDFDKEEIIKKLRKLGAKESPEVLVSRYVFDIESENMEWIRLKEINGKTTLTYKHKFRGNVEVGKTQEIETEVTNFETTAQILLKIPFKRVFYQENKTHIFYLNEIEYSIDTWPKLDPHLEVEADSLEKVAEGLKLLDLEGKDIGDMDLTSIYQMKNIDIHSQNKLKFN
ncbi:MAG: hypothetical protein WCV81_04785 [Microgenomates group bacterium]|jgi:predicted adenylyl cyclase CyaB